MLSEVEEYFLFSKSVAVNVKLKVFIDFTPLLNMLEQRIVRFFLWWKCLRCGCKSIVQIDACKGSIFKHLDYLVYEQWTVSEISSVKHSVFGVLNQDHAGAWTMVGLN